MRPELPEGTTTRAALLGLSALAAARVAGLIALMSALAHALATLAGGHELNLSSLLWWGLSGAVVRALAGWGTRVLAQRAALGVKEQMRSDLVRHRLASGSRQGEAEAANLASRGLDGLDPYFRDYLPALVACAVVPVVVGARILFEDWVSALILVLTIPLVPIFMILIGLYTEDRVEQAQAGLDRLSKHLGELARGLPVLVGLRRADQQRAALAEVSERHRSTTMSTLRTAFLSAFALELISTISVAVVAVFIGVRLVHGSMGLEAGLLALMLAPECFAPLRDLGSAHHASEDGIAALHRVRDVLDEPVEPEAGTEDGARDGSVTVTNLSVARAGGRGGVGQVSFTAPPGGTTVLSGPSGCGKSTVLDVLAGSVRNGAEGATVSGTVTGVAVSRRVVVPQAPTFAAATAVAELELYAPGCDAVAHLSQLLPARLHRRRLERLSPGERRRVAVARGMARLEHLQAGTDAPVTLLLDEPTAHLDSRSAQRVRTLVARAADSGAVVIVATHDAELAAGASQRLHFGPDGLQAAPAARASATSGPHEGAGPDVTVDAVVPDGAGSGDAVASPSVASPSEAQSGRSGRGGRLRAALRLLPLRSGRLWVAVLAGAASVLAAAALSAVSGWLIVYAAQQPPMLYLMVAIVGVRFFGISRSVLRYCERLSSHDVVLRWASDLRVRLWDALGRDARGWNRLTRPGGALSTLIAEVDELRDALPRVLVPVPAAVLAGAGTLITIGILAPSAFGVALVAVVLGVLVVPVLVLVLERKAARDTASHRVAVADRTGRMLAAATDLSANHVGSWAAQRFGEADAAGAAALKRDAFGEGFGRAAATLVAGVAAVLAAWAGAGADPRLLALAVLLLLALDEPFGMLSDAMRNVPVMAGMLRRVAPWISESEGRPERFEREQTDVGQSDPDQIDVEQIDGVAARELAAGYDAGPVFSHVSGESVPGRAWAVTGPSGSGKSTLVATLLGFLTPVAGEVRARRAGEWGPSAATGVAWCPQDGYVFDSTLRGNLALGRGVEDAPSEDEMIHALHRVGLGAWLAALPDGLDTRTGAGGSALSGGQRQRVAVARTLLARTGVVVLDEPTAHLGNDEGHELVTDVLTGGGPTALVLVTHAEDQAQRAATVTTLMGSRATV
ncbi:MAG: thiol reductant ABC exporter subunit CydC [Galactobacter sp.]